MGHTVENGSHCEKWVTPRKIGTYLNLALSPLKLEKLTAKILRPNFNSHKGVQLWAKSINDFGNFGCHISRATSAKNPRSMYVRVAQFVLKIEKSSHIMGPTPILEMTKLVNTEMIMLRMWSRPDYEFLNS